jgi:hypothetical protein
MDMHPSRLRRLPVLTATVLMYCLVAPARAGAQSPQAKVAPSASKQGSMTPAAVKVRPGLFCKLYPKGGKPTEGLPIHTDDDGYARFHALRMQEASKNRYQILDCTDDQEKHSVVPVDFASKDIFAPHRLDIDGERGKARPALTGDPFAYSEIELMKAGYGLRPDPAFDPAAYLSWLMSASTPGRMLESKRTNHRRHDRFVQQAPPWTGSVLTGAPNYLSIAGMFNVPTTIAGGDQTTYTGTSIWNGLGGFSGSSGLIQSGIDVYTTPTSAGYTSFREYCCGDPNSNGYGGDFAPNPATLSMCRTGTAMPRAGLTSMAVTDAAFSMT